FVGLPTCHKGMEECAPARECCCPLKNVFGWRSSFSWTDCGFWQQRWQEAVTITTIPLKKKKKNLSSFKNKPRGDLSKYYECSQRKWLL
ncbi:hypothetical protein N308_11348, partial [Struthio camelus australis]